QDYTVRARVTEGLGQLSAAKTVVGENIANNGGDIAASGNCAGVNTFSTAVGHVASLDCDDATGALQITMDDTAQGVIVTMTPEALTGGRGVAWVCTAAANQHKYVPAECRNEATGG